MKNWKNLEKLILEKNGKPIALLVDTKSADLAKN